MSFPVPPCGRPLYVLFLLEQQQQQRIVAYNIVCRVLSNNEILFADVAVLLVTQSPSAK